MQKVIQVLLAGLITLTDTCVVQLTGKWLRPVTEMENKLCICQQERGLTQLQNVSSIKLIKMFS